MADIIEKVGRLYGGGELGECAELLYERTVVGKVVFWGLILLSCLLAGFSINVSLSVNDATAGAVATFFAFAVLASRAYCWTCLKILKIKNRT